MIDGPAPVHWADWNIDYEGHAEVVSDVQRIKTLESERAVISLTTPEVGF